MNVVKFFHDLADKWNDEQKCGFCWEFDAPLTDSGVNESQLRLDDDCCPVKLFITNLSVRKNRVYNQVTKLLTDYSADYTFTLHALVADRIDTNVYAEQIGHPIDESKWETILHPIEQCLCEEEVLEFCELICKQIQIIAWNAVTRINWLDNNYTGWSITITLRDYDCNDDNCDSGS